MEELEKWHFDEVNLWLTTGTFNSTNLFKKFSTLASEGDFKQIELLMSLTTKLEEVLPKHQKVILEAWILSLKSSNEWLTAVAAAILQRFPIDPIANELIRDWQVLDDTQKSKFLRLIAIAKCDFPNVTSLVLESIDLVGMDLRLASLEYLACLSKSREIFMTKAHEFYERADNSDRVKILATFVHSAELNAAGVLMFRRAFQELPEESHVDLLRILTEIKSSQDEILKILLSLTPTKEPEVQAKLACVFSDHVGTSEEVQTQLKVYLSNPAATVRERAINSLGYLPRFERDLHEFIYPLLSDEDEEVRSTAFRILRWYPDQAKALSQVIAALTKHSNPSIQKFAFQSLSDLKTEDDCE